MLRHWQERLCGSLKRRDIQTEEEMVRNERQKENGELESYFVREVLKGFDIDVININFNMNIVNNIGNG